MITQSVKSVIELLKYRGLSTSPLPEHIDLPGLVLFLSNKKDVYYVVTDTDCSCPSAAYRPEQRCKHQRRFFPQSAKSEASTSNESIRPAGKWPGGHNGPVEPEVA